MESQTTLKFTQGESVVVIARDSEYVGKTGVVTSARRSGRSIIYTVEFSIRQPRRGFVTKMDEFYGRELMSAAEQEMNNNRFNEPELKPAPKTYKEDKREWGIFCKETASEWDAFVAETKQ